MSEIIFLITGAFTFAFKMVTSIGSVVIAAFFFIALFDPSGWEFFWSCFWWLTIAWGIYGASSFLFGFTKELLNDKRG